MPAVDPVGAEPTVGSVPQATVSGSAHGGALGMTFLELLRSVATCLDWVGPAYLQPAWDAMIERWGEGFHSVVVTFAWHEVWYFGCFVPWLICDAIPWCRRYKLQPNVVNDWGSVWACTKHLLMSHFFFQLPMLLVFRLVAQQRMGMVVSGPLPPISEWLWQIPAFFMFEDFYFYWVHRLLHHPLLYPKVHKVHHLHKAPFGIAAEYAHPIETMFLGVGFFIGPLLYCRHLATLWVWVAFRLWETIEDHSGFDLPFNPTNLIPFWAGANHHDHHHRTFQGNYAAVFVFWDYIFGTDTAWRVPSSRERAREERIAKEALSGIGVKKTATGGVLAGSRAASSGGARRRRRASGGRAQLQLPRDASAESGSESGSEGEDAPAASAPAGPLTQEGEDDFIAASAGSDPMATLLSWFFKDSVVEDAAEGDQPRGKARPWRHMR